MKAPVRKPRLVQNIAFLFVTSLCVGPLVLIPIAEANHMTGFEMFLTLLDNPVFFWGLMTYVVVGSIVSLVAWILAEADKPVRSRARARGGRVIDQERSGTDYE